MPSVPSTSLQLLILLVFVLPGSVYQFTRSRLRGPAPDDASALNRTLRALGVSALLAAVYTALLSPKLSQLGTRIDASKGFPVKAAQEAAAWSIILLFVVPAALACLVRLAGSKIFKISILQKAIRYDPMPRAWDAAFIEKGPSYVRIIMNDGSYLAGWYGKNSFVSSYPEPREIYVETAHRVDSDGNIEEEIPGSGGMYVRCEDVRAVEILTGGEEESCQEEEPRKTVQSVTDRPSRALFLTVGLRPRKADTALSQARSKSLSLPLPRVLEQLVGILERNRDEH